MWKIISEKITDRGREMKIPRAEKENFTNVEIRLIYLKVKKYYSNQYQLKKYNSIRILLIENDLHR